MSYQLKVSKKSHGTYVSILQNGKEIEPLSDLYATKDEALQIGKLLELANDCAAATRQAEEQAKRLEEAREQLAKVSTVLTDILEDEEISWSEIVNAQHKVSAYLAAPDAHLESAYDERTEGE